MCDGSLVLRNVTLTDNSADLGAAIGLAGSYHEKVVEIEGGSITANHAKSAAVPSFRTTPRTSGRGTRTWRTAS